MPNCWGGSIRALFASLLASAIWAQSPETLARTLREKPSVPTRASLAQFAKAHPKDEAGALATLALAGNDIEAKQPERAIPALRALEKDRRLTKIADYVSYFLALALQNDGQSREAVKVATGIGPSPVETRAVVLAVKALIELGQPGEAVKLVRNRYSRLDQPAAELALAQALEASGDEGGAASGYRTIYTRYPKAAEATEAGQAMRQLNTSLSTAERYERAQKLLDSNLASDARTEFQAVVGDLTGADRENARLRLGVAYYQARENSTALRYLRGLSLSSPELDAERLYWAAQAARRAKEFAVLDAIAAEARKKYPSSRWTTQALFEAGNAYLATEDWARSREYYRSCAITPTDSTLYSFCLWRVAFDKYRRGTTDAFQSFNQLVENHPSSPQVSAALYFMGRSAESQRDLTTAKSFYLRIDRSFPNHYYGMLARQRLTDAAIRPLTAQPARPDLSFPVTPAETFEPDEALRPALDRARMLATAGLDDYAEREIRYQGRNAAPAHLVAMALAQLAQRRGEYDRSIRFVKGNFPAYLYQPFDKAPPAFWKLAYPMPYREDLEKFARSQELDPFLVAGLIRQESEFKPNAVSRAKAQGLMQVMPATGRELARKLGIKPYSTARLQEPAISLQMGTYHFRNWLNAEKGQIEVTLAAYNAGKTRADRWMLQGPFREPAEFVETIPWTETRDYVQSVLRNADMYRRLYGRPNSERSPFAERAGQQARVYAVPPSRLRSENDPRAKNSGIAPRN